MTFLAVYGNVCHKGFLSCLHTALVPVRILYRRSRTTGKSAANIFILAFVRTSISFFTDCYPSYKVISSYGFSCERLIEKQCPRYLHFSRSYAASSAWRSGMHFPMIPPTIAGRIQAKPNSPNDRLVTKPVGRPKPAKISNALVIIAK